MKCCSILLYFCLLTVAPLGYADIDAVLPALAGGLQMADYQACHQLQVACHDKFGAAAWQARISCTQQLYTTNAVCLQSSQIEAQTGLLPALSDIYTVNHVTWFRVHHSGDGLDNIYLLDNAGRLLGLTSSANPLIKDAPIYRRFMSAYPEGALQSQPSVPQLKPVVRTQADGSTQWLFSQWLKKIDCVACERVGQAEVVYYFDPAGRYTGVQIASITPVPKAS